jgi:tape measure domain-containing protein
LTDIDTASVLIVPDLSKFDSETREGVTSGLADIEPAVREMVDAIERAFADLADQIHTDLQDIKITIQTDLVDGVEAAISSMAEDVDKNFADMAMTADTTFAEIAVSAADTAASSSAALVLGADDAGKSYEALAVKAKTSLDSIGTSAKTAGEKTSTGISSFLGSAALLGGVMAVGTGLASITKSGLTSAANIEQLKISFDQLTGSVQAGDKQYQDLVNFAAVTPFQMQDISATAQRFDAFSKTVGMTQSDLIPFLTTMGNVVSVTGGGAEQFNQVSHAMGEMASRGKLTLMNLNEMSGAMPGFNGALAIANVTGKTEADVLKEISKGQISAKDGMADLLKGMQQFPGAAGAMQKQSETLKGVFSTFKDVVAQNLTGAFATSIPEIKNALVQITPIIGDALAKIGPQIGNILSSLMQFAGPLVSALSSILTPLLGALATGLGPIGAVLQPLGVALGQVATAIAPVLTMAGQLVGALGTELTPIIASLAPALSGLMTGLQPIVTAMLPSFSLMGSTLGTVLLPVMQALGKIFAVLGPPIGQLVSLLGQALSPILGALGPIVEQLLNALSPLWPVIAQLIAPVGQLLVAFMPLIDIVAQLLVLAVDIAAPFIKLAAVLIKLLTSKAIAPLLKMIADALGWVLKWLQPVAGWLEKVDVWFNKLNWGKIASAIGHALLDAWKAVSGFFSKLPGEIWGWLTSVGDTIGKFFSALPGKIWGWLVGIGDAIGKFFASLPGLLWKGLQAIPGLIATAVQSWFHTFFFGIGYMIGGIYLAFTKLPVMIWHVITDLWTTAWNLWVAGATAIYNFTMSIPSRISAIWTFLKTAIIGIILDLWHGAINWWNQFKSDIEKIFDDAKNDVINTAKDLYNGVLWVFTVLPGKVRDYVVKLWDDAKTLFHDGVRDVTNFMNNLPSNASKAMSDMWSAIKSALGDVGSWFEDIGKNMLKGLINGVKAGLNDAIGAVKSAMNDIVKGAKSALGQHSPSKVFAEIGKMTVAGYVQGVNDTSAQASTAVTNMVTPNITAGGIIGAAAAALFGPGSINISFAGVVPTNGQAMTVGQQVGQGIATALQQRGVTDRPKSL